MIKYKPDRGWVIAVNFGLTIVNYFVWVAPVVFISIILYKYIKETGDTRGFSFTATGIMLVPIAITLRQTLICLLPKHQISALAVGNLALFVSYAVIVFGIAETVKLFPNAPKRVLIYILLSFSLVLVALFKREYLVAVNLGTYFFAIASVMYSVEISFAIADIGKTNIQKIIILFGISLLIDFFLTGTGEIWKYSNFRTLETINLSFRFLTSVILIAAARKVYCAKPKKSDLLPEIRMAIRKFLKRFTVAIVIFSIAFSLFTFMASYFLKFTLKSDLKDYTLVISSDAAKTANNIQSLISKARIDLGNLATDPDIINLDKRGEEKLKEYYLENKDKFASVARMSKNGVIIYAYPFTDNIGKNISDQPHVRKLMKTCSPVLSDPFLTTQNFFAVVLHVPVFENGTFDGSVALLINLENLKNIVEESQKNEHVFVTNSKGTIIIARDKDIFLKNVYTVIPKIRKKSLFIKCAFGYGLLIKKVFSPIPITRYTVYAFVPKRDVFANIGYRIIILILLGLTFIISLLYAIRMLYIAYEEETEKLKEFAKTKSEESKSLLQKLQTLVSVFSKTDINKSIEETSKQLLNAMMKLIKKGNAGTVLVKEDDKFVFTAADGYPKFLEGKFLTEEEIMPSISNRPFIIKHIFKFAEASLKDKLKPETRKLFREIGTASIKSTIEAPFIVDGEYYGGIFIDNFEDENAFTDEDLKIAESVSKLASLAIKSKLLINSLKETEDKLFAVMDNFSQLDISASKEEFFREILNISKRLVPQADAGSATLKNGDFYEYVSLFGYREVLKKLKLRAGISYSIKARTASVVKDIAKFNEENLDKEELDILKEAGAFRIKQSVVAPIVVSGEYLGGIFLDSFKEGDVFSDKDVKVVSALSKLASIFVGAHIAYQELKLANTFNEVSLKLFHKIDIKGSISEVLKVSFDTLKLIYGSELQEVALWSKHGNNALLIKYNGEKISELSISPETFNLVASRKESLFVEKGSEEHPFAQAVIYSGVSNMPVFRIRFSKSRKFSKEEREFIERFGREVINIYQTISYYTRFKEMLANYIFSIGNAVESYNKYTELHSMRVGYLSMHIAEKMRLSNEEKALLLFSAILHDVGKIGIPQEILLKPGKLNETEMEVIRKHPVEGEKIVKPINPDAAKIIRHHHERWDGTGYPDGLKGEEIPLLSRIITVADVFDALTTDRPYRKAFGLQKAIQIMLEGKGKMFDPKILEIFLTIKTEILMKKDLDEKDIEEMKRIIVEIY